MSSFITQFKKQPLEKRIEMSSNVLRKYPDRCTIIVSKKDGSKLNDIEKRKFICPRDINLGQFTYAIRKKITNLKKEQAVFIMVNDKLLPSSMLMSQIYQENKDNDGFLYVIYCEENTFGAEGAEGDEST